jgi:glycosyltransferase involved in cell wall biosynthesis
MTVALVHDFLTQRGGAERVVLQLARILRDPVIITALYAPENTYPDFAEFEVRALHQTSGHDGARYLRSRVLSYPGMFRSLGLDHSDLVVISTSAFAHHVRHPRTAVYWHTPPRFLYDPGAYVSWKGGASRSVLTSIVGAATKQLRQRDRHAARAHQVHAANSLHTSRRLHDIYGIDAPVLYPPLGTERCSLSATEPSEPNRALVVSRLLPYKRVDLAIAACRLVGIPLTVVGEGPDRRRLQRLADASVTFRSAVTDAELAETYARHSVVLCPGQEDFGYVPLEAAYAGRPVVAAAGAGADETVLGGLSGLLVPGTDPTVWARSIAAVLDRRWSPVHLRQNAARFGLDAFTAGVSDWLSPVADPAHIVRPTLEEASI